jgi:hypothetical protein
MLRVFVEGVFVQNCNRQNLKETSETLGISWMIILTPMKVKLSLCTTPRGCVGEWMYKSTFSRPRH